jgi:hypothetical protein
MESATWQGWRLASENKEQPSGTESCTHEKLNAANMSFQEDPKAQMRLDLNLQHLDFVMERYIAQDPAKLDSDP